MQAKKSIDRDEDDLLPILEAMLFAAHESLSAGRMARALGNVGEARVAQAIARLRERLDEERSPLMLVELAGGWRLVTRPEFAPYLARLFHRAEKERLSSAALETLAVVAYRQPSTRAEIESVRGVQVAALLKLLQERRLVKVVGRAEVVGRPLQYGTTRRFLDHFGLGSLDDLPKVFPAGRAAAPSGNGQRNGASLHGASLPIDPAASFSPPATNGCAGAHGARNGANGAARGESDALLHEPTSAS